LEFSTSTNTSQDSFSPTPSEYDALEDLRARHDAAFQYTPSSSAAQACDSPEPPGDAPTSTDLTELSSREPDHPSPSVSQLPSPARLEAPTIPTSLGDLLSAIWPMYPAHVLLFKSPILFVRANQNVSYISSRITRSTILHCMGDIASSTPPLCRSEKLYPEIRHSWQDQERC